MTTFVVYAILGLGAGVAYAALAFGVVAVYKGSGVLNFAHGAIALLAGTALSSFAALLLELALTRLFSVVLFYHFAFLAISIALLGLGAGGGRGTPYASEQYALGRTVDPLQRQ